MKKALILAAGIASRLRPLTDHTPKCLLKVGDLSLLERCINGLLANGITEFVIVTGYLNEQIETFIQSHFPDIDIQFIYNPLYASTNNIYSLWLAKPAVNESDFLLLDSDILFDPAVVKAVLESNSPNSLALNRHPLSEEEIKVIVDNNRNVKEISKTCSISESVGESIGIEKISADYSRALYAELDQMILEEKRVNVFYELAFERLIKQGHTFEAIDTTRFFSMELDTVDDFQKATELVVQMNKPI